MPMSRLCGGTKVTSRSPKRISPLSGRMNPASTSSSVVLPDPDGPSRVINSPLAISRLTLSSATVRANVLLTSRIEIGREMVVLFIYTSNGSNPRHLGAAAPTRRGPARSSRLSPERLVLHEGVEAFHHLVRVLDPPINAQQEPLTDVLRRVGKLGRQLLGDQPGLEGGEIGRRVVDVLRQACLNVGAHHDGDGLHGEILVRRPFWNEPAIGDQHLLLEGDGQRSALSLHFLHHRLDTAVPGSDHVDFAALEALSWLGSGVPPSEHVRLQLLEFLDCAVDIDRVELIWRYAVGDQGRLEVIDRVTAHGALTGEVLGIPKGCPACRLLIAEGLRAPADGD